MLVRRFDRSAKFWSSSVSRSRYPFAQGRCAHKPSWVHKYCLSGLDIPGRGSQWQLLGHGVDMVMVITIM